MQKTILERKGPPSFTCAVEMISKTECRVHHRLDATVDAILAGISMCIYIYIYILYMNIIFNFSRFMDHHLLQCLTASAILCQENLHYLKSGD